MRNVLLGEALECQVASEGIDRGSDGLRPEVNTGAASKFIGVGA